METQAAYYASTAHHYHDQHAAAGVISEHEVSLEMLRGFCSLWGYGSLADVGSGTGRVPSFIRKHMPDMKVVGVEPVAELRQVGHANGLSADELIAGDATALPFEDASFDVVTAFGMLHHVRHPEKVIAEMLRVARRAILISDGNSFGQGSRTARLAKYAAWKAGLWERLIERRANADGFYFSEGDGYYRPYSPYLNYDQIQAVCPEIMIASTRKAARNVIMDAETVMLFARKAER